MKLELSLVIITMNEEDVIERCIQSVPFANEIILVDSGSSDHTVELAKKLGAKVFTKEWSGYGAQKLFATEQAKNDWVLSLDADEWLSPELAQEIIDIFQKEKKTADIYSMKRLSQYLGKWIYHGGWYPDIQKRLFKKSNAKWLPDEQIHEKISIQKGSKELLLNGNLLHEPFSSIHEQCNVNFKYAELLANKKFEKGKRLNSSFIIIIKTLFRFFENYIIKRGFLDGLSGFIIAWNSAQSYMLQNYLILNKTKGEKK